MSVANELEELRKSSRIKGVASKWKFDTISESASRPVAVTSRQYQKTKSTTVVSPTENGIDSEVAIQFNSPPGNVFCSICKLLMKDPAKLKCCLATLCKVCVEKSNAKKKCPICGEEDNGICPSKSLAEQAVCTYATPIIPRNITLLKCDRDSLTLAWQIPDENTCKIEKYVMSYCLVGEDNWVKYPETAISESIVVKNLEIGKTYRFKITAYFNGEVAHSRPSKPIAYSYNEGAASRGNYRDSKECKHTLPRTQSSTIKPPAVSKKPKRLSLPGKLPDPETKSAPIPEHPGKPELLNRQTNLITLKWKRPQKQSESISSYNVQCYMYNSTTSTKAKFEELVVNQELCSIKNLTPQTKYVFSIQTQSLDGSVSDEVFSDTIETKGLDLLPPAALTIEKVGATNVFLKWSPTEHADKYLVEYRAIDSPHWDQASEVTYSSCEVSNLDHGNGYVFRVCADSKFGSVSDWTVSSKIFTKKLASGIPGKPYCKSAQNNSIELHWKKPENDSYVKKYEIVCYKASDKLEVKRESCETNSITLHQLASNSTFYFSVRAYCLNDRFTDYSQFSEHISTVKLLPAVVGKPCKKQVTSTTICLSWKLNCDPNEVSKYMIMECISGFPNDWVQFEVTTNKQESTVTDLDPNTEYMFKVKVKSKVYKEYGPESEISNAILTAPVPPRAPAIKSRACTSITLMWNLPQKRSAKCASFYVIQYMSQKDQKWLTYPDKFRQNCSEGMIKGLESGVNYCFRLLVYFNEIEFSETDSSAWAKTKSQIPSPPGKPIATRITQNDIFLSWTKPKENSDFVSYYNIYIVVGRQQSLVAKEVKREEVQIDNLDSDTTYQFLLEAVNPDGNVVTQRSDPLTTDKGLPSEPGRPYMLQVTDNMVKLAWETPKCNSGMVSYYTVYYKRLQDANWMHKKTKASKDTSMEVTELKHSQTYTFIVTPFTKSHEPGTQSNASEPVSMKTALPSPPGKPNGKTISQNSIMLKWDRPQENFENITHYEISYYESEQSSDQRKIQNSKGPEEQLRIDNLKSTNGYYFYAVAVTSDGKRSSPSLVSDLVTNDHSLAAKFIPQCSKVITNGDTGAIPVYLLPKDDVSDHDDQIFYANLKKYDIKLRTTPLTASAFSKFGINAKRQGQSGTIHHQHKVFMLVGATGAGKSTLINGMINYITRVQFSDHFRLKLISETPASQTSSVTSEVSAYTFQYEPGFALPYTFTIVDTPGFGDTAGIVQDRKITEQIKTFFNMKNGIPHLDGIGFVCNSGDVRLTTTQKYIFESIFTMFGKDVINNIFIMCTYCDDDKPLVINAVQEFKIPTDKFYKFNNSALYSQQRTKTTEAFWEINVESFKQFFSQFEVTRPVSLTMTQAVLLQREKLEIIVIGLHERIQHGINLINTLRKELKILEDNKHIIEQNKNVTYQVEEDTEVKVMLDPGKYTTNCIKCNMTCHYPCVFADDHQKVNCAAMSNNQGNHDASCGVCPAHCHWSSHRNAPFRLVTERRLITKEYAETLKKYQKALSDHVTIENVVQSLENDIDTRFQDILDLIIEANECTRKLDEIALRPSNLNDIEYIQLLIDAQLKEMKPGYRERVEHYIILQDRAKILSQTGTLGAQAQMGGRRWWQKHFMT